MIIIKTKQKKEQLNDFESHPHQRFYTKTVKDKGPVVGRALSANPGLKFKLGFFFFYSKAFSRIIFSIPIIKLWTKRKKLNWLFMFSYLNSNFALTLGYLNQTLNNPGKVYFFVFCEWKYVTLSTFQSCTEWLSDAQSKP